MVCHNLYYLIKPCIPRPVQLRIRQYLALWKRAKYRDIWPIDEMSGWQPAGWNGWPDRKTFALVLTHDVETLRGQDKSSGLFELEQRMGFRSSFNFVAERYRVCPELRKQLLGNGFEVGLHGLVHDSSLFKSRKSFKDQVARINHYLADWDVVGFRSPCMYHNLEWMHDLNIEYDASTFDTDPFEPQSDGLRTIFPLIVKSDHSRYVELPYTLPQDFTLFNLMKEQTIATWTKKLDWIASKGGMALINTHPDYMNFNGNRPSFDEYSVHLYEDFLGYIKNRYENCYWHVLPKEMARYWMNAFDDQHVSKQVE